MFRLGYISVVLKSVDLRKYYIGRPLKIVCELDLTFSFYLLIDYYYIFFFVQVKKFSAHYFDLETKFRRPSFGKIFEPKTEK